MNKFKSIFRRMIWFIVDSFAWLMAFCFMVLGLGIIKYNLFGAIVNIFFAFFISPMRRKVLAKLGIKLKKKVVLIVGTILFFISMGQIESYDLESGTNQEYETEIDDVITTPIESEYVEAIKLEEEKESVVTADIIEKSVKNEEILEEGKQRETKKPVLEENKISEDKKTVVEESKLVENKELVEKVQQVNNEKENKLDITKKEEILDSEENSVQTASPERKVTESNLTIHFIDVGQGDATLFICDGEAMLLDAGTTSSGTSVQLYLKKKEIANLKYLILTHPDEDHIGGADVIVTKYNIENVFMPSYERNTKAYEDLINALEYRRYKWSTPSVGSNYSLGGATITVIAPNKNYDDVNESSMGILVTHGNNKFLFTGDAENEAENDIVRNGIDIDCNVFKAGHHGSKSSNSSELLKAVTPEYVVVSCGKDNSYGHPHAGPMNEFRSMGAKLFRTDEQGTIVVESDGNNLTWNTSPTDTWKAGEPTKNSTPSQSKPKSTQNQDNLPDNQNKTAPVPITEPESQEKTQSVGNSFAVNGKNGKIHIVGACSETGNGKQAMKQPVYFETFEEAEEYSIQYHPGQDKRKCGNCYK